MSLLVLGILSVAALLVLFHLARTAGRTYWRTRGERVVTCPETNAPAGVAVNAIRVALRALRGKPRLELSACTRWPERAGCGQECLQQIENAPDGCLVRNILTAWYEGKCCVLCGKDLGRIDWTTHKPALIDSEQRTFEWREIAATDLPSVLQSHLPVCWNCQVIESLVRRHPERVVCRHPPGQTGGGRGTGA